MATDDGDRTRYWPLIEKRTGQPMDHWFAVMEGLAGRRYEDQMAVLIDEHGFARAHAKALVLYCRGSASSKRFGTLDDYLAGADPVGAATVRAILAAGQAARPELEVVIAWNQPMLRDADDYVFGVGLGKQHILLAAWGDGILESVRPRLEAEGYAVNRKTIRVPLDWDVDEDLMRELVAAPAP